MKYIYLFIVILTMNLYSQVVSPYTFNLSTDLPTSAGFVFSSAALNKTLSTCNSVGGITYSSSTGSFSFIAGSCNTLYYTINNPKTVTYTLTVYNGSTSIGTISAVKGTCTSGSITVNSAVPCTLKIKSASSSGMSITFLSIDMPVTPVEMTSFNSFVKGHEVNLCWEVVTEINNTGWEIYRNDVCVGFRHGLGNSNVPTAYFFKENLNNGAYNYYLKQIDNDGTTSNSPTITAIVNSPLIYFLGQNYPNPFNPSTVISYELAKEEDVILTVYNTIGKEIVILVNEIQNAGQHQINFDASKLKSGIYFYTLKAGNFKQTKKMLLIK